MLTTIKVDDVSLAIHRMGQGIPVVCLTAVAHDMHDFTPLAQRVGDQCELICIDWPSHGDSGSDVQPASAKRYAELLEGVLRILAIESPIVIGNSIGGAVAIHYAARHDVRALILCDSGGLVVMTSAVRKICALFERFFAAGERGAWWFPIAFALYYRMVLPQRAARAQRRRIVSNARKLLPALRQAWRSFGEPDADVRAIAAKLDVPIWVAWARQDRVIPLSACMPAILALKNASLDTFKAGHTVFLEQPDEFARKFVDFLKQLPTVQTKALSSAEIQTAA